MSCDRQLRTPEFMLPPVTLLIRQCMPYDEVDGGVRHQSMSDMLLSHPIKGPTNHQLHEGWRYRYPHTLPSPLPVATEFINPLKDRFKCTHCDASFSRKNSLKRHLFTHNLVRPYKCTACSRAFYRADIYHRHLKSKKCRVSRT
ncbi:hypothetical protein L0F63_007088 [Massospora cicadina]|nr:hypothetical protein L0F63_007088 [Massospora cicadina]